MSGVCTCIGFLPFFFHEKRFLFLVVGLSRANRGGGGGGGGGRNISRRKAGGSGGGVIRRREGGGYIVRFPEQGSFCASIGRFCFVFFLRRRHLAPDLAWMGFVSAGRWLR